VLDTSVVYAQMDRKDAHHAAVSAWIEDQGDELITTPLAVAEMDYLLTRVGGAVAAAALRNDLKAGTYEVHWWPAALAESLAVAERHASMGLGLVDASLVALAAEVSTTRIATLDERHFRVLPPLTGEDGFMLLPTDS
jgi:uncharacterized protein